MGKLVVRAVDRINDVGGSLAALLMFLISLFVFLNGAARMFKIPMPWLFEFTQIFMVLIAFVAAGYALKTKSHVHVDLLRNKLSPGIVKLLDVYVNIIVIAYGMVLGWTSYSWFLSHIKFGVVFDIPNIQLAMWVVSIFIPIGCVLLILQAIAHLITAVGDLKESMHDMPKATLIKVIIIMAALLIFSYLAFLYLDPIAAMFIFLFINLFAGVPIAFSLGFAATCGLFYCIGSMQLMQIPIFVYQSLHSWQLTAAPLFILGGLLMAEAKAAEHVFNLIEVVLSRVPSPLLLATVVSGFIFCAITGSSVAAHAAIATICVPILFARGYNKTVSVGVVAGCTVGLLVPPSNQFVLYGVLTDISVGKLFMAAMGPSVVLFSFYIIYILARSFIFKEGEKSSARVVFSREEKIKRIKSGVWGLLAPVIMLGGIYTGIFTPTEGGGVLVVYGALVGMFVYKTIKWPELKKATTESIGMTMMVLFIMAGAAIYGNVLTQSQVISKLVILVTQMHLPVPVFLSIVFVLLCFLGMFLEGVAKMMVTLPLTYPIAMALGIDPLWFGVFYVINIEIGLLTPPAGLNLYVLKRVTKMDEVTIIKGTVPFVLLMILTIIVSYIFPQIVTWLPGTMS